MFTTTMACAIVVTLSLGASPCETKLADEQVKEQLNLHPVEEQIIQFTNAERVRYGLPEFAIDDGLMETARKHATWMTANRSLTHTQLPVAENIAMGQPSAQEALNSWMRSSGHRANILNSGNRRLGVAAYQTNDGTIYWCQQFTR